MMLARLVSDRAAACSQRTANQCALAAAHQAADHSAARSRADNDLGTRMVVVIARPLRFHCMTMTPLRCRLRIGSGKSKTQSQPNCN